jgi:hypothetical protein
MSTRLLQGKQKQHSFHDDLESFVLVALYYILRFTIHNHVNDITTRMDKIFDDFTVHEDGSVSGGLGKEGMFVLGNHCDYKSFKVFGNLPLTSWLVRVMDAIKQWLEYCKAQDDAKTHSQPQDLLDLPEGLKEYEAPPNVQTTAPKRPLKLQNHDWILAITKSTLDAEWPANETKAPDQIPTRKRPQTKMIRALLGSQSGAISSNSVKRSHEPEAGPSRPGKKSKHDN